MGIGKNGLSLPASGPARPGKALVEEVGDRKDVAILQTERYCVCGMKDARG